MIIYKATNLVNGKVYIGQTKYSLEKRMNGHIKQSKSSNDEKIHYFQHAIKKYGENNFKWEIITECSQEESDILEIYYIQLCDSHNNEKGYNETIGGRGVVGNKLTEEQKQKISKAVSNSEKFRQFCKSYNATEGKSKTMKGRVFAEEHIKHLSESAKNREISDEGREKLCKAMQNSIKHKEACKKEEYREKHRKAMKEKWSDPVFRNMMLEARKNKRK